MDKHFDANNSSVREDLFEAVEPDRALELLRVGNRRYIQNSPLCPPSGSDIRSLLASKGQKPFACILGCSDSRVPPELVFDAGLGQLFVVRTAGNTADDIAVGSVEYAAEHLHVPLVVVMGHSGCGAVAAAVSGAEAGHGNGADGFIGAIIAEIQPSLEKAKNEGEDRLACRCEDENILHTVSRLKSSNILSGLMAEGKLSIIGAKYELATGEVDFRIVTT